MKKILCFGDSNTFGFNPHNGSRYDETSRWSGIVKQKAADFGYEITEAGANNRTAFCNNPAGSLYTGYKILPEYLKNKQFDKIILAVGINDLQKIYNITSDEFEQGMKYFVSLARQKAPESQIILFSPSHIRSNILNSNFRFLFDENSVEKSKQITPVYKKIAKEFKCEFFDLNYLVKTSDIDGLHYEIEAHKTIAENVIKLICLNV